MSKIRIHPSRTIYTATWHEMVLNRSFDFRRKDGKIKKRPVCISFACFSVLWLWAHTNGSGADFQWEQKWMWKLNHILNCTTDQRSLLGSHAGETKRSDRVWRKRKSVCVCLSTTLHIQHAAHELLVDWQNGVLLIKMLISCYSFCQNAAEHNK